MQSSERWIIGALLTIALLTFFLPLATLQIPLMGDQDVSGYDLIARAKEFNQTLDAVKSQKLSEPSSGPSESVPVKPDAAMSHSSMPLSVQALPFVPIEITVSFACALVALFGCLGPFRLVLAKATSTIGAVAATASLLHLTVANSDLHTWFRDQMKADSPALANNPFTELAQQIGNLAANAFQLKPGVGLYVLAASLLLATVFFHSRILSRAPLTDPAMGVSQAQINGSVRLLGFVALVLAVLSVAVVVFTHKAPSVPMGLAFRGEFSVSKAFTYLFGNYDPSSKSSSVVIRDENGENPSGKSTLILDGPFFQNGEQKHLLVTSTAVSGEDCHACDAGIGAYVFARREGGWIAEIIDKEIGRFGAWGAAGKAKVVKFAPDVYGFSLTLDDMHQGEADSSELFVAPVSGHFRPVLSLGIESDNKGNCGSTDPETILGHTPCVQSESTIHFLNSIHNGYFDIEVDESGTAYTDQGVIPTNGRKLYLFSSEKYV